MDTEQAYRILQVEPGADPKEVQKAYRRQALRCHPDRAAFGEESERLTRKFIEVRDAYEFLRKEGFPIPESKAVLEDILPGEWAAGRSFAPKDPEAEAEFARKMDYEVRLNLEGIVLWCVVIPGGAIVITLVLKHLFTR